MGVMIPKGTAAAVLAAIPLQMGLIGGDQMQNVIYAVVVTSILVTALFIFLLERTSLARFAGVLFAGYPREVAPTPDGIGSDHA